MHFGILTTIFETLTMAVPLQTSSCTNCDFWKVKPCQKGSEWWMPMRHESHLLQTRVKPPKGQAASLSSSTHMELSVYHPPSWQVVPHPRTYMSSSTARPLPLLAGEVTEKGEERCLRRRGLFFFPDPCLISVFALLCLGLLLIKRRWDIERIWRACW